MAAAEIIPAFSYACGTILAKLSRGERVLLNGTLGCSYKKDAAVSALIGEKIGYTLQITVPACVSCCCVWRSISSASG